MLTRCLLAWDADQISKIVKVCFLLHNMIVKYRERHGEIRGANEEVDNLIAEFAEDIQSAHRNCDDGEAEVARPDSDSKDSDLSAPLLTSPAIRDTLRDALADWIAGYQR